MADNDTEKSEEPTEKRLRETLDKGHVPFSRETTTAATMVGMLGVAWFVLPAFGYNLTIVLQSIFGNLHEWPLESPLDAQNLIVLIGGYLLWALVPVVLPLAIIGAVSSMAQNRPRFVLDRIAPKFSKISPAAGAKRLFGKTALVELAKSLLKFSSAAVVAMLIVKGWMDSLIELYQKSTGVVPSILLEIVISILVTIIAFVAVLAAIDFIYERRKWFDENRMSKQEVKDEHKQSEGDPILKQKTRTLARSRVRARMIREIPTATVVVANPTHFAVALRYRSGVDLVPRVVAKGQDKIALRIRAVAEEAGVRIVEDKPLARSLYKAVQVDADLPVEFYVPVAAIIRRVMEAEQGKRV